ncbi:MAG: SDR family oxidoreductase [Prevotella sp.]|nr:SDR family oxidoreductase [Prevotella sp.]
MMNILVTGGASGLGRAVVMEMAKDKDNSILFTYCHSEDTAFRLSEEYENVKGIKVDFTNPDSVDAFTEYLASEQVDVLVNNAYIGNPVGTHFHKTNPNDYLIAFNDNVLPFIKITQACITGMRKRKFGKIVNIVTSYLIDVPPTGFSVYTTTKACIRQLSKSISKEYGRFNITSNCILPDYMNTGFGHVEDFQLEQMKSTHPLKELLTPLEVAEVVCHLIHSSQQLNGVEIPINSAQHMI